MQIKSLNPTWKFLMGCFLFVLGSFTYGVASAATDPHGLQIVDLKLEGEITYKSVEEFKAALSSIDSNKQAISMNSVQLKSGGGSPQAAMEIGDLIREKRLNTYIAKDSYCDSACVFILIAGVQRYSFGEVGVHRSTYASDVAVGHAVADDVNKSIAITDEYVKKMGVSAWLSDAMNNTESWRIRILTEKEKRQWQVFGTDRVEEEILFNQMARDRHISRLELINIFRSNYDDCLEASMALKATVFECAQTKDVKPPAWYARYFSWLQPNNRMVDIPELRTMSFEDRVNQLRGEIRNGITYLRYMNVSKSSQGKPEFQTALSLPTDQISAMEASNEWWVDGNAIYILLANPSDKRLTKVLFTLSKDECKKEAAELKYLNFELLSSLGKEEAVVYKGDLPFDYNEEYGKGLRCGIIRAAS